MSEALHLRAPEALPLDAPVIALDELGRPGAQGRLALYTGDRARCWLKTDTGELVGPIAAARVRPA